MKSKFIDSFDLTQKKTERTNNQKLVQWMNNIIVEKNIGLGLAEQETAGQDRKQPDIIIFDKPQSANVVCVIELKQPYFDVFDYYNLKQPAFEKAMRRKSKYFGCSNFKLLIIYKTEEVAKNSPEEKQIIGKYILSKFEDPNRIEDTRIKNSIITNLTQFLIDLWEIVSGVKEEPKIPLDELLIFRLQEKIKFFAPFYIRSIEEKIGGDAEFRKKVKEWFNEQSWNFSYDDSNYRMLALQTAYSLVLRILFYNCLKSKFPQDLSTLSVPEDIPNGKMFKKYLQVFFDQVLEIDYEPIYSTNFIDEIAFPNDRSVIEGLIELIELLKRYDFSSIGYDIIGQIFEKLIPAEERHILGQFFTKSEVVDLILSFCIQSENDAVFDPACGASTFLVRAYKNKLMMQPNKAHNELLKELWGADIARFPALLSTINLAIQDLKSTENYPQILNKDFFALDLAGNDSFKETSRRTDLKTLDNKKIIIPYPKNVDCIVGNPPYTRQEEIAEMVGGDDKFKKKIIDTVLFENGKFTVNILKRAGIYIYFILQGLKYLKNGGRLGFIVPSAWLNVDYGVAVQKYFLDKCKIISIIGSKVERWFEDADVNTVILIIEKCAGAEFAEERNNNIVRFLNFKKRLSQIFSLKNDTFDEEIKRLHSIKNIVKAVKFHIDDYECADYSIKTVSQKELIERGTVDEKYIGAKWERYLNDFDLIDNIERKIEDKIVPLAEKTLVRRGVTTGANEFFYPTESNLARFNIEKKYLQPIVFSLKEIDGYIVDGSKLKKYIFFADKPLKEIKDKNAKRYIKWGEEQNYHKRSSCASRKIWYSLASEWKIAPILFPSKIGERMPVIMNSGFLEDKKFYGILPIDENDTDILLALLNCSLTRLLIETNCRQLTGAQAIADIDVKVVKEVKILDYTKLKKTEKSAIIKAYNKLIETAAGNLIDEYGTDNPDDFSIAKLKKERYALDKIIFDILGFSENEITEIYKNIIGIISNRKIKSASVEKNGNGYQNGINLNKIIDTVLNNIDFSKLNEISAQFSSLAIAKLLNCPKYNEKIEIEKDLFGWRIKTDVEKIDCEDFETAEYLTNWAKLGFDKIPVPKNKKNMIDISNILSDIINEFYSVYDSYTDGIISRKILNKLPSMFRKSISKELV